MHVLFQAEPAFLADEADGRIGRHPHCHVGQHHADMVGAVIDRHLVCIPAGGRAQLYPDACRSRHRTDDAGERDRAVHSPLVPVAGAEIDDVDGIALCIRLPRDEYRGVADIMLFDRDAVFQFDRPETARLLVVPMLVVEQGGKDRVSIDPGHAGPHHAPGTVDKGRGLAIADGPKVQGAGGVAQRACG